MLAGALLPAAPVAAQNAGERISLKLRLETGKTYTARMVAEQKIVQDIAGQKVNIDQTFGMGFKYDVQQVDARGNATVKVSYTSVQFKQDGPVGKIDYDSRKPAASVHPFAKGFSALVGESFTLGLSPTGRVLKIEGLDAMLARMFKQIDAPDDATRATLEKKLKEQFGERAMKDSLEQLTAIYPETPVAVGDAWQRKLAGAGAFPLLMDNTWTLLSRSGGRATVGLKSKLAADPQAKPLDFGPLKMKIDLSGDQEGTYEVDEASGWVVRGKMTQNLSGKLAVQGDAEMLKDAAWPMSLESTMRWDQDEP